MRLSSYNPNNITFESDLEVVKNLKHKALIVLAVILAVVVIGPFLILVPQLEGTVPPGHLADPDSFFVEVNGLTVHCKTAGSGGPVFLLLHGFGASVFSWREVMEPLSHYGCCLRSPCFRSDIPSHARRVDWSESLRS